MLVKFKDMWQGESTRVRIGKFNAAKRVEGKQITIRLDMIKLYLRE